MLSAGQGPTFVRRCCSNKHWFVTATAHLTDSFLADTATWSLVTVARASSIPWTSAYRLCLLWLFFELTLCLPPHRLLRHSLYPRLPPTTHTHTHTWTHTETHRHTHTHTHTRRHIHTHRPPPPPPPPPPKPKNTTFPRGHGFGNTLARYAYLHT